MHATAVTRLSGTERDAYFAVSASGGDDVSVVLHVIGGFIGKLEIFAERVFRCPRRTPIV